MAEISTAINEAANVRYLQARRELGDVNGNEQKMMDMYKNGFTDGVEWALLQSGLEAKETQPCPTTGH